MSKTIQQLCIEHGCDKTPEIFHAYAPIYDKLFKELRSVKAVLEIGVGYPKLMKRHINLKSSGSGRIYTYKTGASLYVWRDYFPGAIIYGLDINPEAHVTGESRIKTFLGDATDKKIISKIAQDVGPFDIVVDDGSHRAEEQLKTAQLLLPYVKSGGLYFIEDVTDAAFLIRSMPDKKIERLTDKTKYKLLLIRC